MSDFAAYFGVTIKMIHDHHQVLVFIKILDVGHVRPEFVVQSDIK
jgi:hypothetical protein